MIPLEILATALGLLPAALPDSPRADAAEHVRVRLVADRAVVKAGERFRVGALLEIEPGWHVYWINAGEGGFPTRATFTAPEGFRVGPLRFPAPHRFEMPGEIEAFGFERELLLVADVVAPAELAPTHANGDLVFAVKASWLSCAEVCIPGDGQAELRLRAGAESEAAPQGAAAFERWQPRMPRPWSELQGGETRWSLDAGVPTLRVAARDARVVELFPHANGRTKLDAQRADGAALVLAYHFRETTSADPRAASGVVRVLTASGAESFYELNAPWDPALDQGSAR